MSIKNKKLADILAWTHLLWILFGLISLPLMFLINSWHKVTLIFVGITVLFWIIFRGCWLRQLENQYRKRLDPTEVSEEGFIQQYIRKYFNINVSRLSVRVAVCSYMVILIWVAVNKLL